MPGLENRCVGEDTRLVRVVAALIEREGRLLICQRRRGDRFELQWEFPGGKLQPSETPRAGLLRELREELGSSGRVGRAATYRTLHRYQEFGSLTEITFFPVRDLFPAPRNLCAARMVWAPRCDLPRFEFLAANRELVARLARGEYRRLDDRR
jgi:8-oxo-dGTP diphosphatase